MSDLNWNRGHSASAFNCIFAIWHCQNHSVSFRRSSPTGWMYDVRPNTSTRQNWHQCRRSPSCVRIVVMIVKAHQNARTSQTCRLLTVVTRSPIGYQVTGFAKPQSSVGRCIVTESDARSSQAGAVFRQPSGRGEIVGGIDLNHYLDLIRQFIAGVSADPISKSKPPSSLLTVRKQA